MNNLPPLNDQPLSLDRLALARLLAPILYKAQSTILRDIRRNPGSLPAPDKKSGKRKIWLTAMVYHWIFSYLDVRVGTAEAGNNAPAIPSLVESLLSAVTVLG